MRESKEITGFKGERGGCENGDIMNDTKDDIKDGTRRERIVKKQSMLVS